MLKRNSALSAYWFALGGLFATHGGLALLSGTPTTPNDRLGQIAKLVVGIAIIAYAAWLRRKERRAIAAGTQAPNEDL